MAVMNGDEGPQLEQLADNALVTTSKTRREKPPRTATREAFVELGYNEYEQMHDDTKGGGRFIITLYVS